MTLNPKQSGEFIVQNAQHLQVHDLGITNLANQIVEAIVSGSLNIRNFSQHKFHPKATDVNACNWIFLIDTLNFCFWTGSDQSKSKWNIDGQTGYFALCAAIKRSMNAGIDVTNPKYYFNITEQQLGDILRSDDPETTIPLLKERVECLHEVGTKLIEKYDGDFKNVAVSANGSSKKLLELIVQDFPCFRDEATFKGQRVSIYKRAQILVGDLFACFQDQGIGHYEDIYNSITMFADYRVPQVLVHFGALTYNEELKTDLNSDKMLINGEPKEVEIRGASIYIVEATKEKVVEQLKNNHPEVPIKHVNSILIDHFLWDYRRANAELLTYIPFHKTQSIYY